MESEVTDVHIQDLATALELVYDREDFRDAFRRFQAPESATEALDGSVSDGLRELAGTDIFREVVAYLVREGEFDDEERAALQTAVSGSRFSVLSTEDDGLVLYQRIEGVADRTLPDKRDTLESLAPDVVLTQIESAETNLAEGEYDLAMAELRRAFDMLVVGGQYDEALQELIEHDLITVGGEHENTDTTILYVVYGYCSYLGSDPEYKEFETSRLQAEVGLAIGLEALYFLLEVLDRAVQEGVDLRRWEID